MAILVNAKTRVITQGFTGAQGTFHSEQAIAYGTKITGGVTPGKGGTTHLEAAGVRYGVRRRATRSAPTPPRSMCRRRYAADAILEAIDAEIPLIVCITEGIPVLDMVKVKRALTRVEVAPDRAELSGRHHAGCVQDRHHAGPHPSARLGRDRVALRHADL